MRASGAPTSTFEHRPMLRSSRRPPYDAFLHRLTLLPPSSHAVPPPKHAPSIDRQHHSPPLPGRRVHLCFPFSSSARSRLLPNHYTPFPQRPRSRVATNTPPALFIRTCSDTSPDTDTARRRLAASRVRCPSHGFINFYPASIILYCPLRAAVI